MREALLTLMPRPIFGKSFLVLCVLSCGPRLSGQTFDFENGLAGWQVEGNAFDAEPYCASRMLSDRFAQLTLGGDYWKGLEYPVGQHGTCLASSGQIADARVGALRTEFALNPAQPYFSSGSAGVTTYRMNGSSCRFSFQETARSHLPARRAHGGRRLPAQRRMGITPSWWRRQEPARKLFVR